MRIHQKPLWLIFLILTISVVLFSGCTTETPNEPSGSSQEGGSAAETNGGSATPAIFTIAAGGKTEFRIVRPAELGASDPSVQAAQGIKKFIFERTDAALKLGDDWIAPGTDYDGEAFEILVGQTAYPETAVVASSISYGQYAVRAVGNKIVVFSYTELGYSKAVSKLTDILEAAVTIEADGAKGMTVTAEALDIVGTTDAMASALPIFEGGDFLSTVDMGDGCSGIIIEDTTRSQYEAYISQLTSESYVSYSTNEIAGSCFTVLYNESYTVNAGFYDNINEVRIIIEPYGKQSLPTMRSDDAPVTTTQLTMLGVEGIYNGNYQNNGLSLIYRLSDGSFVIVDGGHSGNSAIFAANILKALREQSKDYAASLKDIRIAAWIITHPHGDHSGTLVKEYKRFSELKVERIMTNFWSSSAFEEAKNTHESFTGSYSSHTNTRSIATQLGAEYVIPHVGQVWYFGDTEFEFLYTIESFLPRVAVVYNTASIVFRTTTRDTAGRQTTTFIPGDATGEALELCTKVFGEYIKSDILQVTHHGLGNGGSESKISRAYTLIKPSVVLWPIGMNRYKNSDIEYLATFNHALFKPQNTEFEELYIAGWQGNSVTLPLPYVAGSAKTNDIVEQRQ